jgi:hypothetical protein
MVFDPENGSDWTCMHADATQKIVLFVTTAVRTSNPRTLNIKDYQTNVSLQ